jgi:hypothetical protein
MEVAVATGLALRGAAAPCWRRSKISSFGLAFYDSIAILFSRSW